LIAEKRTAFLWFITQRVVTHYLLHNNPEERSSQLLRSGSLKSYIDFIYGSVVVQCIYGSMFEFKS